MTAHTRPERITSGIVIAGMDHALAGLLQGLLIHEFPEREVLVAPTTEAATESLSNGEWGWLLLPDIVWSEQTTLAAVSKPTAVEYARKQLALHDALRVIIVTSQGWSDDLGWTQSDRLAAAPTPHMGSGQWSIVDMIIAGDQGLDLIAPTEVKLRFHRPGKGPLDERACVLEAGNMVGPLAALLDERAYSLDLPLRTPIRLAKLNALAAPFHKAAQAESQQERKDGIREAARDLWNQMAKAGEGPLLALLRTMEHIPSADSRAVPAGSAAPPSRIHLQIMCEPHMLAVPLDVALGENDGRDHVCAQLPITWYLRVNGEPSQGGQNLLDWKGFAAGWSCSETIRPSDDPHRVCPALTGAEAHVRSIAERVGAPPDSVHLVADAAELRELLIAAPDQAPRAAYLVSHGVHDDRDPDSSGILLGPKPADTDTGVTATAANLKPGEGACGAAFAYFNCCDLARQSTEPDRQHSYFGGFAEAALREGVCRETVCNRWSVSEKGACQLAEEFFRRKMHTEYGRAVSLHMARRTLRGRPCEDGETPYEVTWLAPVHIVAH